MNTFRRTTLAFALLVCASLATAATLSVQIPDGCTPQLSGFTVTCTGGPPPPPPPPPPPLPPPPPTDLCSSYSGVVRASKAWGDNAPIYTQNIGGFPAAGVVVIAFTAPATPSYAHLGSTQVAEYQGPPTFRQATISRSACDFRAVDPTGANGPYAMMNNGVSPSISWNVGAPPLSLPPATTFYYSVRNWYPSIGNTCTSSPQCNAIIQFNWPN